MTKIVFGIMSAFQRPATVKQLADALDGRPVVIHHDFLQRPVFTVDAPNVTFVPNPVLTGWGTWGYCEAIVRTLEYCLANVDFDYFQLLSPTCLPIRPISEFEQHAGRAQLDGYIDLIDLQSDADVMMTFGWRFLAPQGSLRLAAMRRARSYYFAAGADSRHRSGLSMLERGSPPRPTDLLARLSLAATQLSLKGWLGKTPFSSSFRPFVGSCWFGANRALCQHIVDSARDPAMQRFFESLPNVDESFFPTVIGNSGFRLGPSNHLVNFFNDTGNPHWFRPGDLTRIVSSGAWFGRKFPDDPGAQIRIEALDHLRRRGNPAMAEAPDVTRPTLPRRTPRLAFGLMSAVASSRTIAQLTDALSPYPVILHQDYAQQPDFVIKRPNVSVMPEPVTAGKDTWYETQAMLNLLRYCLDHVEFDYLQLLNPLCLPIRPLHQLASLIGDSAMDAHTSSLDITDGDAMMSYGCRVFASRGSRYARWLEAARTAYFGRDAVIRDRNGCAVWSRAAPCAAGSDTMRARLAYLGTRMARRPSLGPMLPEPRMRLYAGSPWFGATREVCEYLLKRAADPGWQDYFRLLDAGSDLVFATMLGNSGFRLGESNLYHSPFDGRYRRWLQASDLPALEASGKYFAYKFSDNPDSPARLRILERTALPSLDLMDARV